jgi:hypothetical protein
MWLFTSNGFLSIVDKAPNPDQLVVRARCEGHIEAVFPDAKVIRDGSGDYLFRAFIDRPDVADALFKAVMDLDYPNFKNSIKDDRYHNACSSVWGVMSRLQPVPPYSGGSSRNYDMFGSGSASAGKTATAKAPRRASQKKR